MATEMTTQEANVEGWAHHATAGEVLMGLGIICFLIAAVGSYVFNIEMKFIDAPTMMVFSAVYVGLGFRMVQRHRQALNAMKGQA